MTRTHRVFKDPCFKSPCARDVPDDVHVRDLMWRMGQVLYDLMIWVGDHASSREMASRWHAEADEIAAQMEAAVVDKREIQWQAYEDFSRRHGDVARLIDEASST